MTRLLSRIEGSLDPTQLSTVATLQLKTKFMNNIFARKGCHITCCWMAARSLWKPCLALKCEYELAILREEREFEVVPSWSKMIRITWTKPVNERWDSLKPKTMKRQRSVGPKHHAFVFWFLSFIVTLHLTTMILLSLLVGEMVRVSKLDLSVFLRTSGLDGAVTAAAWEGEAGGAPAWAAWWQAAH